MGLPTWADNLVGMSRRGPLPPPPPPVHLRSWPGRDALLADRHGVLADLGRRSLGAGALALFWLLVAGVQLGWALIGAALTSADGGFDPIGAVLVAVLATLGLGIMLGAGIVLGILVRRQRVMRGLMVRWAELESDPAGDARFRMAGPSLWWLLTSFVACAVGLWIALVVPATAEAGEDTYMEVVYGMGAGTVFWIAGLIGGARAVEHYRWAVRLVVPSRGGQVPR